jgi:cytochrome P450
MTTAQPTPMDALAFNPFDPAFRSDPYPTYRRLRNESPVHQSPFGLVLSRYADCSALLRDARVSSDQNNADISSVMFGAEDAPTVEAESGAKPFLFMDPPDHTRLRGLVNKAFTPRVVEHLRDRVQQIVDELIGSAAAKGEIEVIEDLAYPLPVRVICEMLGVPPEDHETFRGWSHDVARGLDPDFVLPADFRERRQRTFDQLREYFVGLIAQRRAEPRDDLISALIAAEEQGQVMSEEELVTTCGLLLIAGHETTVNLIANGTLALLRHPHQLRRLRDDPSLIRTAVEEVLRFDPPVQMTARIALEDIDVGGTTFRKGQLAILLLAAANRDEAQFSDPETFDIGREDNRHLAFGMGIHFCVGAPLARVEGQIALGAIARRLKDPQLMLENPAYKENLVLRGLEALPVRFSAVV